MKFRTAFIFILLGASAVVRADDASDVASDTTRWDKVAWSAQRHQAAPAGWQRVEELKGAVSFSMPCVPQLKLMTANDMPAILYSCHVGKRVYQVTLMPTDLATQAGALQRYWIGTERGIIRTLEKAGAGDVQSYPQMRVAYEGGSTGRQMTLTFSGKQMEFRALAGRHGFIGMIVTDVAQRTSGDMPVFFNSLETR